MTFTGDAERRLESLLSALFPIIVVLPETLILPSPVTRTPPPVQFVTVTSFNVREPPVTVMPAIVLDESIPSNFREDIVVAPELGWQFTDVARDTKGAHGYFPQSPDMQVMFRAIGPDFKTGYTAKGFVNVDIYPLLSYLLQIVPEKTDGQFERIRDILR